MGDVLITIEARTWVLAAFKFLTPWTHGALLRYLVNTRMDYNYRRLQQVLYVYLMPSKLMSLNPARSSPGSFLKVPSVLLSG
jgi:hypothetical protein